MYPDIDFYDQDFLALYADAQKQEHGIMAPLWMCYTTNKPHVNLDDWYAREPSADVPIAWLEYNVYHKTGKTKRVKMILPRLDDYFMRVKETGNRVMLALNYLYASSLADAVSDAERVFLYRREYYRIKNHLSIGSDDMALAIIAEIAPRDANPNLDNPFYAIKAYEKQGRFDEARGLAIRTIYDHLDVGVVDPLMAITCFIENIIGASVSVARKSVDWMIPDFESMGVWGLELGGNAISLHTKKQNRGRMVSVNSNNLIYFTFEVDGYKRRSLPIPHGMCSVILEAVNA